jgi:Spy/CpxP family protein refolding chaperone
MRPRRWRHEAKERLEHLKQELNLTQEQSDQIAAIIKGNAPQRQAIMNNDSLSPDEKRARMWELRQGTEARIRTLLTPEQQTKFDAMPRGHGGRNGGPGGKNPTPPPPPAPPANPPGGGNT